MPSHIAKVLKGSGRAAALADQWTGTGRIYSGAVMRGCTGRPGFLPNTIDHAGVDSCGVHEGDRDAGAAYG